MPLTRRLSATLRGAFCPDYLVHADQHHVSVHFNRNTLKVGIALSLRGNDYPLYAGLCPDRTFDIVGSRAEPGSTPG